MTQLGFSFDANKCTGCNACQIACIIENQLDFSHQWRQVITFNDQHHPALSVFHLSLACNHCANPPCMKFCPALAYSKDPSSGIVRLDDQKCIGCHYCSWVCPYDAPRFQKDSGIMTKCTLCQTRLDEKSNPACVALCPTDALRLIEFKKPTEQKNIPGFTPSNINPSIEIIPLEAGREIPRTDSLPFESSVVERFEAARKNIDEKNTVMSEWSLLIFTLLIPILVVLYAASISGRIIIAPEILLTTGLFGMVISSWHLGKKSRAYRALFSWQNSWLSREIVAYSLFLIFFTMAEFVFTTNPFWAYAAVVAGIMSIISIDMVYAVIPWVSKNKLHSAQVVLSSILFYSMLSGYQITFIVIILFKAVLFIQRMLAEKSLTTPTSISRISFGFVVPALLLMTGTSVGSFIILGLVLFAEVIDRVSFYMHLDIITPIKQMEMDYRDLLSESDLSDNSNTEL